MKDERGWLLKFVTVCVILSSVVILVARAFPARTETSKVHVPVSLAKLVKIAVIDTGFNKDVLTQNVKLCNDGHTDFTDSGDPFIDTNHHGTHVAGIIGAGLGKNSYCIVILKYYDEHGLDENNIINTVKALKRAIELKVDIINYSGGGIAPFIEEHQAIEKALNAGIKVIVAAGNEHSDLRKHPYYPACYDNRIIMVGSTTEEGIDLDTTNYIGKSFVDKVGCANTNIVKDVGQVSLYLKAGGMLTFEGTSQATAMRTAKEALKLIKRRNK